LSDIISKLSTFIVCIYRTVWPWSTVPSDVR